MTEYRELSTPYPLHHFVKSGTTYTLTASRPIARARLVVTTTDSDGGWSYGLGVITALKANNRLLLAGSGAGVPVTLFAEDSLYNPILELDLQVNNTLTITYSPDAGSVLRPALVVVP